MAEKKSGLASISEGRSDILRIDPRKLNIKPNWNFREIETPDNKEHIEMLTQSIIELGVQEPLTVYWEEGKAWVSDGHCRLLATLEAIKRGIDVKTVPVKSEIRYSNEADRIFSQVLRNSGKPFTQLEQAKTFKKLLDLGWQQGDIAKKAGLSGARVSQILNLLTLPTGVQTMVNAGTVSPTLAVATVKASGTQAEEALKAGLAVAQSEGKSKVTAANLQAGEVKLDFKKGITEAFESCDIDDSDDEVIVVKFSIDKWSIIAKLLDL